MTYPFESSNTPVSSSQSNSAQKAICPDALGLIAQAGEVGNGWQDRLGRFDRRRAKIQEMNFCIAELVAAEDDSPKALDAVRTMLCMNCSKLHPGLATLCSLQPEVSDEKLHRCWLLKGSHCEISRLW